MPNDLRRLRYIAFILTDDETAETQRAAEDFYRLAATLARAPALAHCRPLIWPIVCERCRGSLALGDLQEGCDELPSDRNYDLRHQLLPCRRVASVCDHEPQRRSPDGVLSRASANTTCSPRAPTGENVHLHEAGGLM